MPRTKRWAAGLALVCGAALTWAAPPAATALRGLAPTLDELDGEAAIADERLGRAEALITALARIHNRLGEGMAAGSSPCADPGLADLWARSRALGPGVRDAAQAARAASDRVARLRTSATVAPLLDADRARALDSLASRASAAGRAANELGAWQARALPAPSTCTLPALRPALGLRSHTAARETERIGVLVSAPGVLCGTGLSLAVTAGPAAPHSSTLCWAPAACDCTPRQHRPGAVLGPGPVPADEPNTPAPPPAPVVEPSVQADVDLEAGPPPESAAPAEADAAEGFLPPTGQTPP